MRSTDGGRTDSSGTDLVMTVVVVVQQGSPPAHPSTSPLQPSARPPQVDLLQLPRRQCPPGGVSTQVPASEGVHAACVFT